MKALPIVLGLLAVTATWIAPPLWAQTGKTGTKSATLRVGTFDSRAVAVAYAGSENFNRRIRGLMDEYKNAKAAGDRQKADQLEAESKAGQRRLHEQGFSTASVANILETIKDQLPAIAQKAGVDVIVSKWDIVYQAPGAEFVDVTRLLIEPFHPNERALRNIEELEKHAPIPMEEARKISVED